jgi:hypothetical protein
MIPSGYPYDTHWVSKEKICTFFYHDTQQVASWYPLGIMTLHTSRNMCGILDLYVVSLIHQT